MKHLRSHNYRFLCQDTFTNQQTLNTRNTLLGDFDTKVTTSHHHTVSHFQDFINVINAFLILYLGHDTDITVMSIQNFLYIQNILFITHKRMSNKVDVFLNGIKNIGTVLFRQRRKIDAYSRHIYALTTSQSSIILYLTYQIIFRFIHNNHFQITIINKDVYANGNIVHKVRVGNGNTLTGSFQIWITYDFHSVTDFVSDRIGTDGSTHLRAFSIHQDSYTVGHRTHIIYQHLRTFAAEMCRVHTHHIHTGFKQAFYKINIATLIRNGCNDFCLFQ